ncbi:hypothetical protein SAMN06264365_106167 [Actinoplanes regularis]|uniref:Uncharacterized protein n=1 Tax=Actinoplanes regularis TaxID=52697 RepID=A0A238ZMT7_9ACTN|nr:hypothetical protein SAMN06264365_106167 [Actinoplanes regularis]
MSPVTHPAAGPRSSGIRRTPLPAPASRGGGTHPRGRKTMRTPGAAKFRPKTLFRYDLPVPPSNHALPRAEIHAAHPSPAASAHQAPVTPAAAATTAPSREDPTPAAARETPAAVTALESPACAPAPEFPTDAPAPRLPAHAPAPKLPAAARATSLAGTTRYPSRATLPPPAALAGLARPPPGQHVPGRRPGSTFSAGTRQHVLSRHPAARSQPAPGSTFSAGTRQHIFSRHPRQRVPGPAPGECVAGPVAAASRIGFGWRGYFRG